MDSHADISAEECFFTPLGTSIPFQIIRRAFIDESEPFTARLFGALGGTERKDRRYCYFAIETNEGDIIRVGTKYRLDSPDAYLKARQELEGYLVIRQYYESLQMADGHHRPSDNNSPDTPSPSP